MASERLSERVVDDTDLVPLHSEPEATGFDRVLRGYDPRQVHDYVDRLEAALSDAQLQAAELADQLTETRAELSRLTARTDDLEARAEGRPEPASLVGGRLKQLLVLAEQEAAEMRSGAAREAEQLVSDARAVADAEQAERTAELEQREQAISVAQASAERTRLEAQQDADLVRDAARRDADEVVRDAQVAAKAHLDQATAQAVAQRRDADEDVRHMHDRARAEVAALRAAAEAEVDELAAQRDAIAEQLHGLQGGLASVTALLGAPGQRSRERAAP